MQRLSARPLPALAILLGALAACSDSDEPSLVGPGNGVSATVSRVVVQPKVDTIFARDSLLPTDTVRLQAAVVSFNGGVVSNPRVTWSTRDTAIVTVDSTGTVRPRRLGVATITAASGNKDDQATVAVVWAARRLTITSPSGTASAAGVASTADTLFVRDPITAQDSRQLRARAIAADGDTLTGVRYQWTSSNPNVATVDSTGIVRARGVGATVITVRGADLTTIRNVVVASVVREVQVSAPATQVLTDDSLRLTARVLGQDAKPVTPSRVVWTSSNRSIATVDSTGLARFVGGAGTVRFTATTDFVSGSTGTAPSSADVAVQERVFLSVDAGWDHSCGTITLGRVYCWGRNGAGQLGGTVGDSVCFDTGSGPESCGMLPQPATTQVAFARVTSGDFTTCGVSQARRAYCWGAGDAGKLGNGAAGNSPTPTLVTSGLFVDSTAGAISVGGSHACAITTNSNVSTPNAQIGGSQVVCWGDDQSGQLGTQIVAVNSTTPIPSEIPGLPAMRWVSAGYRHTCAVANSGQAFCWGRNWSGETGVGSVARRVDPPTQIAPSFAFSAISAGGIPLSATGAPASPARGDTLAHTCGLTTDGRAVCWGANFYGQVGNGASNDSVMTPTVVQAPVTFRAVSAGGGFTCALGSNGNIYCWGLNDVGQLGTGSAGGASGLPVPILNPGVTFVSVSAGRRHACGLANDNNVYCWGSDVMGAIGSELQARVQPRPTRVARPL